MTHEFRSTPSFPRHKQLLAILKKNISILVQHDRVRDHLGLPPSKITAHNNEGQNEDGCRISKTNKVHGSAR